MGGLPGSPAADRNKQPIFEVLCRVLPARGTALEVAAGTGQHAAWFAARLPGWRWLPTDFDAGMLPVIAARTADLPNVLQPRALDAAQAEWPLRERFELLYCANMIHIAPWTAGQGLLRGAARHLVPGGLLVLYGPYLEADVPTAPSNAAFDQDLRSRNGAWGLRRLDAVAAEAADAGLVLRERHALPANNLLLVFALDDPAT
ncbi:DUF938 domain-containing protein [Ramlibacter sp. AW1]|uniref:DUF938 domain-containing protein n=1 Tax=Ramlibacter aurantiacus TaxID=2801330 RepID=A0A936ZT07_9BURK|nr:DUF938 domain-containing protein [Ramlibacter aurantiacus]MBL0420074.1 DUF938 domain-containing protein [Ramlibacter aurantiacus]